jgi:hypothetical protein
VGFKLDGSLRRQLESIRGPDQRYLAPDESFLRLCRRGDDLYVGKVISDGLSTDRVDDVRRNVLSIVRRLAPEMRLPQHLEILVCATDETREVGEPEEASRPPTGAPSRERIW